MTFTVLVAQIEIDGPAALDAALAASFTLPKAYAGSHRARRPRRDAPGTACRKASRRRYWRAASAALEGSNSERAEER